MFETFLPHADAFAAIKRVGVLLRSLQTQGNPPEYLDAVSHAPLLDKLVGTATAEHHLQLRSANIQESTTNVFLRPRFLGTRAGDPPGETEEHFSLVVNRRVRLRNTFHWSLLNGNPG